MARNTFWNNVAITADDNQCWNWQASTFDNGYGSVRIDGKQLRAHRVAWMFPNYVIPDGLKVCHSCDNKLCCNPKHLFIGTSQDNSSDMVEKERSARGEKQGSAKLTESNVIAIRQEYAFGNTSEPKLALKYGVSSGQIHKILKRRRWAHI